MAQSWSKVPELTNSRWGFKGFTEKEVHYYLRKDERVSIIMILTDKSYIEIPSNDSQLLHYLGLYQLLSILNSNHITFSSIPLYTDKREATLTEPSCREVLSHSLLEENTPVKKDKYYLSRQQRFKNEPPLMNIVDNQRKRDMNDLENMSNRGFDTSIIQPSKTMDIVETYERKIDTFAWLIHSFSRHFMFAHCWSIADTESILMWDRYKHLDATVAIKTTVERVKIAFSRSIFPVYIGKVQYKDYDTEHITGFDGYSNKDLSDPKIIEELFYQPVFHKQKLYENEHEVRMIISYEHFVDNRLGDPYFSNIPYYDDNWGFKMDPDPYGYPGKKVGLFFGTKHNSVSIGRIYQIEIDINALIENIIISPYAPDLAQEVLKHTAFKLGFDHRKIVQSSIELN
ncbi:MAG: hypothetical protein OXI43_12335 [Candidatus Poribacteria bacterium]|nr:hypothetical protein [Candidatus Poribacteria bacterium]